MPEFIINEELYLFQEILTNVTHFNISYDHQLRQYSTCFRDVIHNMYFLVFCSLHSFCTSFSPSINGELVITDRVEIEVHAGKAHYT